MRRDPATLRPYRVPSARLAKRWLACCGAVLVAAWAPAAQAALLAQAAPETVSPAETHIRLGLALRELDRDQEAIEAFRQALEIAPDDKIARLNLGSLLAAAADQESLEHLEWVVARSPEDSWALYELAEALRHFDRWQDALTRYQSVVTLDPAHENGRVGEADALVSLGRFGEARTRLEEARELFPGSRGIKFGLAWLLAASPDPTLRDGERASVLAQELFNERRSLGALELVALARAELGRCEEAVQIQRTVVGESLHHDRPAAVTARLARSVEWFEAAPCRVPAGRPATERPQWPRSRPSDGLADAASAPSH